eukprot:gene8251-8440_t
MSAAAELHLSDDSLFNAVAWLDSFLSVMPVQLKLLQPAGVACLWLSTKHEEGQDEGQVTGVDFAGLMRGRGGTVLDDAPQALQLLLQLKETISTVVDDRHVSRVTITGHVRGFLLQLCRGSFTSGEEHHVAGLWEVHSSTALGGVAEGRWEQLYCMTTYLTEASLLEHQLLGHRPEQVAAAAFALAGLLLGLPGWDDLFLLAVTGHPLQQLATPMEWLCALYTTLHAAWAAGRPYAVTAKYSNIAMHAVATVVPITSVDDRRIMQCAAGSALRHALTAQAC